MQIVKTLTDDRDDMANGDWNYVLVFEGEGRREIAEVLVKAADPLEVGKAALSMMPAGAMYAIVGARAGRHLGGPVDAMVMPDGSIRLCRAERFEESLFWSYQDDDGTGRLEFATGFSKSRKVA